MKVFWLFPFAVLLAGCASTKAPVYSESFVASINDLNMRQFHYNVMLQMDDRGGKRGGGGPPGGGPGGPGSGGGPGAGGPPPGGGGGGGPRGGGGGGREQSAMGDFGQMEKVRRAGNGKMEEAIFERLDQLMAETQYCKHGYFVIDKSISGGQSTIFGECKATVRYTN